MSLATPEKIRSLQRKLYCKAKAEPAFRFYVLYDKICREDILRHAYRLARANAGAAGVDGVSFAEIEEQGLEAWLAGLREDLVSKTYRPDPVRRVMIPKPDDFVILSRGSCGRGAGVDEGGDDEARADHQRGQDLAEERPRSSNRTCGFPASGSPTGFTARPTTGQVGAGVPGTARRAFDGSHRT